jgi:hypothetical protein
METRKTRNLYYTAIHPLGNDITWYLLGYFRAFAVFRRSLNFTGLFLPTTAYLLSMFFKQIYG